ncbi:MAG: TolC family protein [Acidobacteriota bacterium]
MDGSSAHTRPAASTSLVASLPFDALRDLVSEVLERNPDIARARRLAAAAAAKAPQVRALPEPVASLSFFVLPPETRAGPQRATVSVQQKFPGLKKLKLKEQSAVWTAAAAEADVETRRLNQLTETRRLVHEMGFLEAFESIVQAERGTLVRYEKAAQARYASGTGLQQEIVRIQAQITRTDTRLLEIAERRSSLSSRLNRLRDRPATTSISPIEPVASREPVFNTEGLLELARRWRPEVAAAEARVAAAAAEVALAERAFRPEFSVGLSYSAVERRNDAAAERTRIDDDGDDVFALTTSVALPVRRRPLEAGLTAAQARRWAADEGLRAVDADIEAHIGDLATRIPLLYEHLQLLESVLHKQAREALRSAETAYSTGKLNAIDLLDAEVVLFEVRIAEARTRADLAVAWAELERAVGGPIPGQARLAEEMGEPTEPGHD